MIKCPYCGSSEHYHKLTAFVEAETSVRVSSGRFIVGDVRGKFGTNPILTSSFERSLLADKATCPVPNFTSTRIDWKILSGLLLLLAGVLAYGRLLMLAGGALALSGLFFFVGRKSTRTAQDNHDE